MIKLSEIIAFGNLVVNIIRLIVELLKKNDSKKDRS